MTVANPLNIPSAGIPVMSSTGVFTTNTTTNHAVVVGAASNGFTAVSPSVAGYVLTDNGPSADPSFQVVTGVNGLTVVSLKLTSSQIKNLKATPVTLVAAPGANKIIVPVGNINATMNYGGTNAFTSGGNIDVRYHGTANSALIAGPLLNAGLVQNAGTTFNVVQSNNSMATSAPSGWVNLALDVINIGASEFAGNAANDNTITVSMCYFIHTLV